MPVEHPRDGEQPIEVFHLQLRVVLREVSDGLIVIQRPNRSDELVGPSDIMDELSVVRRASERREICFVCLHAQAHQSGEEPARRRRKGDEKRTSKLPGSTSSAIERLYAS